MVGSLRGILIGVGYLQCPEKIPFHGYPPASDPMHSVANSGRFGLEALTCFEDALSSRSNCFLERALGLAQQPHTTSSASAGRDRQGGISNPSRSHSRSPTAQDRVPFVTLVNHQSNRVRRNSNREWRHPSQPPRSHLRAAPRSRPRSTTRWTTSSSGHPRTSRRCSTRRRRRSTGATEAMETPPTSRCGGPRASTPAGPRRKGRTTSSSPRRAASRGPTRSRSSVPPPR